MEIHKELNKYLEFDKLNILIPKLVVVQMKKQHKTESLKFELVIQSKPENLLFENKEKNNCLIINATCRI